MTRENTYVRARIDIETKERATAVLSAIGLSVSDVNRMLMLRVADEQHLPFELKVPNKNTVSAMQELKAGRGKRFDSVDDLMVDLNADD